MNLLVLLLATPWFIVPNDDDTAFACVMEAELRAKVCTYYLPRSPRIGAFSPEKEMVTVHFPRRLGYTPGETVFVLARFDAQDGISVRGLYFERGTDSVIVLTEADRPLSRWLWNALRFRVQVRHRDSSEHVYTFYLEVP